MWIGQLDNASSTVVTQPIELDDNYLFQKRSWFVQRIAWIILALILGLAALGGLGTGWLSSRSATSEDGRLSVQYFALNRLDTSFEIEVEAETTSNELELSILGSLLEQVRIERITPEPKELVMLARDSMILRFPNENSLPQHIKIRFTSEVVGLGEAEIRLEDTGVSISTFTLP